MRLCIFGDSHLGCGKAALDAGLVDTDGVDVEFWGADGPLFRQLEMVGGEVHATPEAAERIALVNGRGRTVLSPTDFDMMLVLGARLRTFEFFAPSLHLVRQAGIAASEAVARKATATWMEGTRAYRFARSFAQADACRVVFAPVPFPTEGVLTDPFAGIPLAAEAEEQDLDRIWAPILEKAAADGVTMIRQPAETVTQGCLTKRDYGVENAVAAKDAVHKNGAYGALILTEAIAILRQAKPKLKAG